MSATIDNILQRINEVRKEVPFIKKDASIQGYKAVTHDQVTSRVRDSLVKHGVIIIPMIVTSEFVNTGSTTSKGAPIMRFEATYNVVFYNCDDKEDFIEFPVTAHAMDFGDKAPGKCVSYATKSAILKMFNIETGENDESRIEPERTRKDVLVEALNAHSETINSIINCISSGDLEKAYEARSELSNEEFMSIWVSPKSCKTMGIEPPFTTSERSVMKSEEWSEIAKKYYESINGESN